MSSIRITQGYCTVARNRGPRPINIAYALYGSGKQRIFLVQGRGSMLNACKDMATFYAKLGYQVCAYDSRGIGQSDEFDESYTMMDMALDAVDLLHHLKWKSHVHIVGTSMGGSVTQLIVAYYPQYFASICFTSTVAHAYLDFNRPGRGYLLSQPDPLSFAKLMFPEEWLFAPCKSNPDITNLEWVTKYMARTQEQSKARINSQTEAMLVHCFTEDHFRRIRETGIPILVCTGDSDKLMLPANSEYIAAKLKVPLKVFKGCGHFINLQEPELYYSMLLDHFRRATNRITSPVVYASL